MERIDKIELKKDGTTQQFDVGEEQVVSIKNVPSSSIDYAVIDENDDVIMVIGNGHIRTKNFDSRAIGSKSNTVVAKMEHGGIDSNGCDEYSISSFNTKIRTSLFILIGGATDVYCSKNGTVYQFGNDGILINKSNTSDNVVQLNESCSFIRFSCSDTDTSDITFVFSNVTSTPKEVKRFALRRLLTSLSSSSEIQKCENLVYAFDGDLCTTARLMLPNNYSQDGNKVPLIIWDSGDGSFTQWTSAMGSPTNYTQRAKGLMYLRDMGFAVLEIYSWGSKNFTDYPNCGGRSAQPIPTHIATHEKGVEYVLSRYNIDGDNIFHLSKSGSGKLALYYSIVKPKFNLRSIYAMSPVFDDFNFGFGSDFAKAIHADMNFEDVTLEQSEYPAGYSLPEGVTLESGLYYFLNGIPAELSGTGSSMSWRIKTQYKVTEDANGVFTRVPYVHPILAKLNRKFVEKNAAKFNVVAVCWNKLVSQQIGDKIQDSIDFATTFWNDFTLITSQPSSWGTSYKSYYKGGYVYESLINENEAPRFELGLFYSYDSVSGMYSELQGEPTGWENIYTDYYRREIAYRSLNSDAEAPEWENDRFYKHTYELSKSSYPTAVASLASKCYNRYDLSIVGDNVPLVVIMGINDEQTPYWNTLEVVEQLNNGGCEARMITMPMGGHSGPDIWSDIGDSRNLVGTEEEPIVTYFGENYIKLPIGWWYITNDIFSRYLKSEYFRQNN